MDRASSGVAEGGCGGGGEGKSDGEGGCSYTPPAQTVGVDLNTNLD